MANAMIHLVGSMGPLGLGLLPLRLGHPAMGLGRGGDVGTSLVRTD